MTTEHGEAGVTARFFSDLPRVVLIVGLFYFILVQGTAVNSCILGILHVSVNEYMCHTHLFRMISFIASLLSATEVNFKSCQPQGLGRHG